MNSTNERRVCACRAFWDVPWAQLSHGGVSPHYTGPVEVSRGVQASELASSRRELGRM